MIKFSKLMLGFRNGVFLGVCGALFFSFFNGSETFQAMPPQFSEQYSTQLMAFFVTVCVWGLIGVVSTLTNLIYSATEWSILRMTVTHGSLTYLLILPLALFLRWLHFSSKELILFTGIYVVLYFILWLQAILSARRDIAQINHQLRSRLSE